MDLPVRKVENRLQLLMDIYNTTASPLLGFDPSTHPWLYNKLAQCALTVDCLIRLAVDPLSAEVLRHPALELMPPIPESAATFQMYVRVHPTTLGEATTAMETLRVSNGTEGSRALMHDKSFAIDPAHEPLAAAHRHVR